ncbi:RNA polymerase sigma-70 factor [Mucilaginibacter gynuensis]|uniref:RNA polymerase sigma-70 factor n=1 Tax=Mucilaginibacter gynuensis TaxID=1302236 RepID=A0ABP8G5A3_9SPHI
MIAHQVIQDLKDGRTDAFDRIYDYYAEDMWALCYKYTRSREITEELVNDIFLRIWNRRSYIDPEQGIKNYLYATARSILHNWFQSVARSKRMQKAFEQEFLSGLQEARDSGVDAGIDVKTLRTMLNALPPKRRAIFEQCKMEGMSYAELATYFSITRNAVKDHMVKANKVIAHLNKSGEFFSLPLFVLYLLYLG